MPTYEYECKNCGHAFEALQTMKEEKLRKCPECGEETLQRLIGSGAGLIFKGSGFYLTDYAKKNNGGGSTEKKDTKKDSTASKETSENKTAKTESPKESAPSQTTKDSGKKKE
jgi:putative FmdB family regulatory protein